MNEPIIYIGIPQWPWKRDLIDRAQNYPNYVEVESSGLCYECSRHQQILEMFDRNDEDFKKSEYFKYQFDNKRSPEQIKNKIEEFRKLYKSIKRSGCLIPPIVTDDGCRLDGSHRSSILVHIGTGTAKVNLILYEDHFNKETCAEIRKQVADFRRSYYGLESP